jgi:hypothetical protein
MVGTENKKNYIHNYYGNTNNRKEYCIYLSEKFSEYGLGDVLWTSIQTNWFSKRNLPREQYKVNRIYDFTKEFARAEVLRTEAENELKRVDAH